MGLLNIGDWKICIFQPISPLILVMVRHRPTDLTDHHQYYDH